MIRTLPLVLALTATVAPSQTGAQAGVQSSERRFAAGGFDAVELTSADHVRVVPGRVASVVASGDPRAIDALAIDVRGASLRIGRCPGTWRDKGAIVTVTLPVLRGAAISGSGDIDVARVESADFSGSVSGSGNLAIAGMTLRRTRFTLGGSGTITAIGTTDSAAIELGGSGRIDTRKLRARDVTIMVGGSGGVSAAASHLATVRVGGSGNVRVVGGARCSVVRSGSGSVRCD